MNVQHWIAEELLSSEARATHESVVCKACTTIHFIDRQTGKLLGETKPPAPDHRNY